MNPNPPSHLHPTGELEVADSLTASDFKSDSHHAAMTIASSSLVGLTEIGKTLSMTVHLTSETNDCANEVDRITFFA